MSDLTKLREAWERDRDVCGECYIRRPHETAWHLCSYHDGYEDALDRLAALEAENGRLRAALQTLLESAYPAITPPPDDCVDFMIDEYFILEGDVAATIKAELAAVQALGSQHEA